MSSPTPTTKELLNRLASWKSSARQAAIQEAKQLGPDALLDLMQQGRKRLQRRRRQRWLAGILYVAGGSIAAGFMGSNAFHLWRSIDHVLFTVFLMTMLCTFVPRLQNSLTTVFEDMQDAAFVSHLLTLLDSYGFVADSDIRKAQDALERLLPRMSREQLDALTPLQRQTLLKPLAQSLKYTNRGTQTMVYRVRTILKALEQIGDQRELPLVEQLAAIEVRTHMDQQLQQAAAECLPYLQIRAEEQRQQTTLLRPSASASGVNGETLLRATLSVASVTPDEQLLRAARQE